MKSALPCFVDETLQEFFKVFLLKTGSSQLQIPPSFTKFFNGTTPCKVTLVDHDRKSWVVHLEKIDGRLIFKNGWQLFVREKVLEEGDFLVFQYDGSSMFNVKIFSKTGCRKVSAPASCVKDVPTVILDEDFNLRSNKIQYGHKRKHSPPSPKTNGKSVLESQLFKDPCSSDGAVQFKSKRVYEENDNQYEKKPSMTKCVPLLQQPHFQIYFDAPWRLRKVEVPRRVLKGKNIKLTPKISLRDESERLWPVSITTTGHDRHFLVVGWCDFLQSNNIQLGHQCDFQFVVDKTNVAQELLVHVRSKCPMHWVNPK